MHGYYVTVGKDDLYNHDIYQPAPRPAWNNSLRRRPVSSSSSKARPEWNSSMKTNSPSERTYAEGGSLRTQRSARRYSHLNLWRYLKLLFIYWLKF